MIKRSINLGTIAAIVFIQSSTSLAFELNASEMRGKSSRKPVSVLQNRFFLKSWRPEIGVMTGTFLNEAYTSTTLFGARAGLFFNEWFGAELQYFRTEIEDTEDRKALNEKRYRDLVEEKEVTPDAEVNPIHSAIDINGIVAPFYGKLNLIDQFIIYSDLYLTTGYSKVETSQGDLNAYSLGIGQRFYMMESFSVRLDFRDRIYTEQRRGSSSQKNALSIDLGASYFFL